jgi:DNA-binding transcriptional MerR regulator
MPAGMTRGGSPEVDASPAHARPLEPGLTISAVSEQIGVTRVTLRSWQRRYGLGPSRVTAGGHRRYTPTDVERLRSVRRLITAGIPTGEAIRAVLARTAAAFPPAHHDITATESHEARRFASAVLDLDGPTSRRLLREHVRRAGIAHTWELLLRPALLAADDGHHADVFRATVAARLLTCVATTVLREAVDGEGTGDDPVALLACVPGEEHELPLVALWAALAATNPDVVLLPTPTSTDRIVAEVEYRRPPVVVLFALMADRACGELFDRLPTVPELIAAGPGWTPSALPDGVRHVDALADAAAAVLEGARPILEQPGGCAST